jgi:hypothetical protein
MEKFPNYINWKIFNSKYILVLFVVVSLGYLYSEYSDRQLEIERTENIYSTKTFYCKGIGFDNPKSCISFLDRNEELFLEILIIKDTLERLKVKFDSYYGRFLGILKKGSYEDLRKMNFYTNYMTDNDYQLVKFSEIREQPLNSKIKINAYIYSLEALLELEGDLNNYFYFTEYGYNSHLIDNKLSHKYLTFDQAEQITKTCNWIAGMCPANIYIEIQKCKILPYLKKCLFKKPILVIEGIKFLKKNFAEFVSQDRSCLKNLFNTGIAASALSSNITKSKNIEILFEKNLINKTLAKVSCKGNDYYEFTKDIQTLNRIRKKYPFILKNYNEVIEKLEILIDPVDGLMKLSAKGRELVAREINYLYSDKKAELETREKELIEEVKELF